ncbi:hypothetical protein PsorP6_005098 [Peronosclerospora sorghi]|uniref:Uncharacterized protein n=1 Tax=Peronosclerospora sorghi TaxID=230839 RepID=A0ACC0W2L5_9STRA|nr:hypothetical protein PsorP6_005098 [Peronosclerospora sorghi]
MSDVEVVRLGLALLILSFEIVSYDPVNDLIQVAMSKNSVDSDTPTKSECLEMFRALKNKDELSRSCKELMQRITANDKYVMECEPLNTYGGGRTRGGVSHAALQRRLTGKMSGISLSG